MMAVRVGCYSPKLEEKGAFMEAPARMFSNTQSRLNSEGHGALIEPCRLLVSFDEQDYCCSSFDSSSPIPIPRISAIVLGKDFDIRHHPMTSCVNECVKESEALLKVLILAYPYLTGKFSCGSHLDSRPSDF